MTEVRLKMEDLEHFLMSTSESINDKLEEIHTQMSDLLLEITTNIDLV